MNTTSHHQGPGWAPLILGVCATVAMSARQSGAESPPNITRDALAVASVPAIDYDVRNSEYRLSLSPQRSDLRLYCRSGRFTGSDAPGVEVRDLRLEGTRITGQLTVGSKGPQDKALYQLEATVTGGQVMGTCVDGKGVKGKVTGQLSFPIASQEDIAWFETARLGIGMHWGISTVGSGQISWSMGSGKEGKERYEAQMKEFKAQNFNPNAWAKLFKEAGAQYFIPYVKHHDGFCMWDTQTHDYKVTKTPCGRDVIGELYAASRKEGLRIGVRFSQADWHIMPRDMWPGGAGLHARLHGQDLDELARHFGKDGAEAANFKVKGRPLTKEQLERVQVYEKVWKEYRPVLMKQYEELLTKYGPIDLIGGDGGYPVDANEQVEMAQKFRQWSPGILFGSRVFFNCPVIYDTPVYEWPGERPRPETRVLPIGGRVPEVWQSYTNWGNGPRRGDASKPLLDLVTEKEVEALGPTAVGLLVRCASVGWNLLYDVGPHDTGDLARQNIAHLRALAKYMRANAESITGTWGGPYQPCWLTTADGAKGLQGFVWGTSRKGDRIFLHVCDWNGSETVQLPPLPQRKIVGCSLLADGEKVAFEQTEKAISVTVPAARRQWVDTVTVLRLDGSAEDLPIIGVAAVEPAEPAGR